LPASVNQIEKPKKEKPVDKPVEPIHAAAIAHCPSHARATARARPLPLCTWSQIYRRFIAVDLDPLPERPPRLGVGQGPTAPDPLLVMMKGTGFTVVEVLWWWERGEGGPDYSVVGVRRHTAMRAPSWPTGRTTIVAPREA
jgi:hypothetical protein